MRQPSILIMNLNDKKLPPPPRPPRPLDPWGQRSGVSGQVNVCSHPQTIEIQALLREIRTLKGEMELLVNGIRRLTEENHRLMEEDAQNDKLRQDLKDYQEALKNIMSYTLVTVSECRTKAKERQAETVHANPVVGTDIQIGMDSATLRRAEASALI